MTAAVLAFLAVLLALPPAPPSPVGRLRPGTGGAARDREAALPVVAGVAAALAVALLVGGTAGVALGPVAGGLAYAAVKRMEPPAARRRREALADGLSHAVDLMAACLAAGRAPVEAVVEVAAAVDGPLREELTAVASRLRLGVDPPTVWRDLATHPQLGPWGRCMLRATDTGASVADAMTRLAEDLRRDARAVMEARARAVGVRSALPLGVCLLPAFVLLGVVPLVAGSLSVLSLP